jgi:hypothetical protein
MGGSSGSGTSLKPGNGGKGGGILSGFFFASGTSTGAGTVRVAGAATGGNGGAAGPFPLSASGTPALAGSGGSVSLSDAVSGSTLGFGGSVSLSQDATGGDGGSTSYSGAGSGGAANSILNFITSGGGANFNVGFSAGTIATGGNGGVNSNPTPGALGGLGGNALAQTNLINNSGDNFSYPTLNSSAAAFGGAAGSSTTSAGTANATATANSFRRGIAQANAIISGRGGNDTGGQPLSVGAADAITQRYPSSRGGSIRSMEATGLVTLPGGQSSTEALQSLASTSFAFFGGTFPGLSSTTGTNALAVLVGNPSSEDVKSALGATHPAVSGTFDRAYTDNMGLASLGGGAPPNAPSNIAQTFNTTITLTLDSTQFPNGTGELEIGLIDRLSTNAGFSSLRFRLQINGASSVDRSFTDLGSANTYFTDHVLDLGVFPSGTAVTFKALLDVTTLNPSDGYDVDFVIGNVRPVPETSTGILVLGGAGILFARRRLLRN